MSSKLLRTVKAMAEVRVIRRWPRATSGIPAAPVSPALRPHQSIHLVAIGASTGGPPVLRAILTRLPSDFPVPVVVVQHIAAGFVEGLTQWLTQTTGRNVQTAVHGQSTRPGHVYFAPDGAHLTLGVGGRLLLTQTEMENGLRPAVSCLFRSVAAVHGPHAAGVLLTGMGKDGAEELKTMQDRGAVTIAQDRESCVVHGMPAEAIRLGAATYVLPPDRIAATLMDLVGAQRLGEQATL